MVIDKKEPLRLSRWAHMFFKKGVDYFATYHSLNIETIFLEKKFHKIFKMFKIGTTIDHIIANTRSISAEEIEDVCNELFKVGIIVPVLQDDKVLLSQKQQKYIFPPGLETMYLIVTDTCNLKCKYCFINNNMPTDYKCSVMSWETAKEAVDMYFSNISKNPPVYDNFIKMIIFYGGEPLLNFNLIKDVILYIEDVYEAEINKMGNSFRFSIVTNGTAITDEIADFFGKHTNIDIAISLDGLKETNDKKRVFVDGCGSFDCIIKGYNRLKEIGSRTNVALSCTIDSHNIDHLDDLLKLHDTYNFAAINLNSLLDTEQKMISKAYMIKVSQKMIEYFILAREKGVYEDRIMRKASAFVNKEIHPFDCQAAGAQIVCSPDGKLGICHEGIGAKNFFFEKVSNDFKFHENLVIKEWKMRTPLNMPQCWDCSALGICGGGCTYGAWLRNGSIWSIDDRFCIHSLMTLEWLIWDLFEKL
jgi:uncharacterized protein